MCNKDIVLCINKKKVAYIIELRSRNMKYKVTICRSHKACFLSLLLTHIRIASLHLYRFLLRVLVIHDSDNTSCPWCAWMLCPHDVSENLPKMAIFFRYICSSVTRVTLNTSRTLDIYKQAQISWIVLCVMPFVSLPALAGSVSLQYLCQHVFFKFILFTD